MNYENMSVDDLVLELVDELLPEDVGAIGTKSPRYEEIESALRKAVVREESQGSVAVRSDVPDSVPGYAEKYLTLTSGSVLDGVYDLIPRATA